MKRMLSAFLASSIVALASVAMWSPPSMGADDTKQAPAPETAPKKLDKVTLANGRVVEGEILEETATQVTMMVHFGNLQPTKTTYDKTEIIDIQRGVIDPTAKGAAKPAPKASSSSKKDKDDSDKIAVSDADPDAALIYLINFEGTFGSDISNTPIRDVFRDVDLVFNDLVEEKTDAGETIQVVDPSVRDKHIVVIKMDCGSDPRQGFDGIFRAEEIGPIFEEQTQQKHRRVVFWIKEARDGAAFIPWLTQEIYFHPDGKMFFTSDLDKFSSGDKMVDAKLVSARMGHAQGFAIDGGHDNAPAILDAMAKKSKWLCYRLEGGEPVFLTRKPTEEELAEGWEILSDDGKGENADKNKVRFTNDQLVLDARIAQVLGVSKGNAKDVEELAFALDVQRNYSEVENRGQKIFDAWKKAKDEAFTQINTRDGTLWRDYQRIQVGGDFDDRRRLRGQQLTILKQIRGLVTRFAEVWDPDGGFRSDIDIRIEVIKQQQQADKAAG